MVHIDPDCKLGPNRVHVLPPTSICPTVLDRQRSVSKEKHKDKGNGANPKQLQRADSTVDAVGVAAGGPGSFQITPLTDTFPLLVFVNPKSGGRQGARILRKCQYLLNPRQVFNLAQGGPTPGLQMFREVANVRIIVCGGDGTVGWVLDALGK